MAVCALVGTTAVDTVTYVSQSPIYEVKSPGKFRATWRSTLGIGAVRRA